MKHRIIRHACLTLALTGLAACGGGGGETKTDAGTRDTGRDGDSGSLAGAGGRGGGGGGSGHGGTGGSFISSGGSGGPVAGADGGVTTDGPGGAPGTGGGVTSSGGSGASGGIPASGGAGGSGAGTGGTLGTGGGAVATGGSAMGTGGSAATGGRVGSGGTSATGGRAGTGGAVGTGGAAVATGGAPGSGGAPGTGGAATGGAGTGGAATGGRGTGGAGTGGAGTGGAGTGGAGTGGTGTGGAATGGAGTGGAGGTANASMYVVAHPDDDLLFMNPDLEGDIVAGKAVTTVYVTSGDGGDAGGLQQALDREKNVRSAHAAMANNAADAWTCAVASYDVKSPQRCVLTAHPSVRSIYLRILDGTVKDLADGSSAGTIDTSTTYTSAQLTAVLAAIQAEVHPNKVGVLDASRVHGPDHDDHAASAQFALDVARADGVARQVTMYRGYSMAEPMFVTGSKPANEAENLVTSGQYTEKLRIIHAYQSNPLDDGFDNWCRRMYPLTSLTGGPARLHTAGGQCLQTGATSGSAVSVATCNGAAAQNWTVTSTGRVLDSTGKCLGVVGAGVVVETCDASADERWSLLSDEELKGPTDQCAQVSGTAVTSSTCTSDMVQPLFRQVASQRWNF